MSTYTTTSRLWPEDTVEYHLFSSSESSQESLIKLAVECTHYVKLLTKGHIWHYGAFTLSVWAGKEGRHVPINLILQLLKIIFKNHMYIHKWGFLFCVDLNVT